MGTRVSFLSVFLLALFAIYVSFLLDRHYPLKKSLAGATIWASILILFFVISFGWFYLKNHQKSGSFFRSTKQDWISNSRKYKSFDEVFHSKKFWLTVPRRIYGDPVINRRAHEIVKYSIFGIALIGAIFAFLLSRKWRFYRRNIREFFVVTILFLQVVAVFAQQMWHAVGYGAYSPRYFLPAVFPIAFFLVYGLTSIRSFRGALLSLAVIFGLTSITLNLNERLSQEANTVFFQYVADSLPFRDPGFVENFLSYGLTAGIIFGGLLTVVSLWKLYPIES
jgi:hypothetical protein